MAAVDVAGTASSAARRIITRRSACGLTVPPTLAEAGAAMDSREETTDVAKVVQALANGIRSELEIAKTARLALDRVQIALTFLVALGCAVEVDGTQFRLTDNGNDMVKEANAAKRKHRA